MIVRVPVSYSISTRLWAQKRQVSQSFSMYPQIYGNATIKNTLCSFHVHSVSRSILSKANSIHFTRLTPYFFKTRFSLEKKYMRRTAGYIWTDYKTNTQIAKELKITPILDKLLEYKRNWIQHVNRMPRNRLPRVTKHYSPTGRRNHGRPFKRVLDT